MVAIDTLYINSTYVCAYIHICSIYILFISHLYILLYSLYVSVNHLGILFVSSVYCPYLHVCLLSIIYHVLYLLFIIYVLCIIYLFTTFVFIYYVSRSICLSVFYHPPIQSCCYS